MTISNITGIGGCIVKELVLAVVFTGLPPVLAVAIVAMLMTGDWRAFGLVILAAGLIGTGLAGYFHWRAKLRHQLLGESDDRRAA
jgi:hypothetical protein